MPWRDHPQSAEGYLWIMKPHVVFQARVNQTGTVYPTATVPYDGVTLGDYTDLKLGMTVLIGSLPGREDLGRTYLRGTDAHVVASSSVLNIGYSSRGRRAGEVDLTNDAYITVLDLYEPWKRQPKAGKSLNSALMDYELAIEGVQLPVAHVGNTGGLGVLDFIDSGTGTLELEFDASGSYTTAPSNPGWGTRSWDVDDGTITVGSTSSEAITATFPAGYRWITRQEEDGDGTLALPRRYCVVALDTDGENAPIQSTYEIKWSRTADGQVLNAKLRERLDPEDYPHGTVVMLLVKEQQAGVETPLSGYTCKFAGWLSQIDSQLVAGTEDVNRETSIRAVDLGVRLQQMKRGPSRIEREGTPINAYQLASATLPRYLWWELCWHSFAPLFSDIDLDLAAGADYPFAFWSVNGGRAWDICNQLTAAYGRVFTCDMRGRLRALEDTFLLDPAYRPSPWLGIEDQDWQSAQRMRPPIEPLSSLKGDFYITSSTDAADLTLTPEQWHAVAPGQVEGRGTGEGRLAYVALARNRYEFWVRLGHAYARRNSIEGPIRATLAHGNDVGIDPASKRIVSLSISETVVGWNDLPLVAQQCVPQQVDFILSDGGYLQQSLTLEVATVGTPGVDDPKPVVPPPRIIREPVLTPVPPYYNPTPIWNGINTLPVAFYGADADGPHAAWSTSFDVDTGLFVWQDRSTGLGGNGIWDSANPWNYEEWWHLSTDGLYQTPSMESFSTWTQIADNADMFGDGSWIGSNVIMSPYLKDWLLVTSGSNLVAVTFNRGVSWTVVGVNGAAAGSTSLSQVSVKVALGDGALYAAVSSPSSADAVYQSTDNGLNWSLVATDLTTDTNIVATPVPNVPYIRQDAVTLNTLDSSQEVYFGVGSGNRGQVNLSDDAGGTWSVEHYVNAGGGVPHPMGCLAGWNLMSFTFLGDVIYFGSQRGVGVSEDGGATVTYYNSLMPSATDFSINLNGYALHSGIIIAWNRAGTTAYAYVTVDLGGNWALINSPTFFSGSAGQRHFSNLQGDLSAFIPAPPS